MPNREKLQELRNKLPTTKEQIEMTRVRATKVKKVAKDAKNKTIEANNKV